MRMVARRSDTIARKPMRFLARGWLVFGAEAILVGHEGIGKSLWWSLVAAHVTTGRPFPAIGYEGGQPLDVLAILTEDSEDEARERVHAAGGDATRLHFFGPDDDDADRAGETPVIPGDDADDLRAELSRLEQAGTPIALLVVDAWLDTTPGALKIADTQQARRALRPWHAIARAHDLAVLLITHTNRMPTGATRDLYGATIALRQKARVAIFAAKGPDGALYVGVDKINSARKGPALYFDVDTVQVRPVTADNDGTVGTLRYRGRSAATITDLVATWFAEARQAERVQTRDNLGELSRSILAFVDQHPEGVRAADVAAALAEDEHTMRTYLARQEKAGRLEKRDGLYATPVSGGVAVLQSVAGVAPEPARATSCNSRNSATQQVESVAPPTLCRKCGLPLDPTLAAAEPWSDTHAACGDVFADDVPVWVKEAW